MYTYYKLDNGRVWDIPNAKYVSCVPEGSEWAVPVGEDGKTANEAGLYFCLKAFGYPLGELATDEDIAKDARVKRNELIAETDYLVMPDYPLPDDKRQAVLAYRQALRDVPAQYGFPRQIDWPLKTF